MVIKHPNAKRMGAILIEEDMRMKFDDYLKEQLQDPEFKKEWEKIQPEYELVAKRFSEEKISPKGRSWDDLEKELFTPEEIAESDKRVAVLDEKTKASAS